MIQPLLRQLEFLNLEITRCEDDLETVAAQIPEVQHLRQIPGVGLIVGLYFVLTIDDPDRFRHSRDLAAFFGLRSTMRSSGDMENYGRITKQGDPQMRKLLVQAAHALMLTRAPCALQDWAKKLEARRGKSKAIVALARKMAVLMHHLWVTGEVFESYPDRKAA